MGSKISNQNHLWDQAIKKVIIDPSISVAALNMGPEAFNTIDCLKTFGFIFENLCIRDLSVYTSKFGGKISYYHDNSDVEVDCVASK